MASRNVSKSRQLPSGAAIGEVIQQRHTSKVHAYFELRQIDVLPFAAAAPRLQRREYRNDGVLWYALADACSVLGGAVHASPFDPARPIETAVFTRFSTER